MMKKDDEFELVVRCEIRQRNRGGASLSVDQTVSVSAKDFLSLAEILGRFNQLADKISKGEV